MASTDEAVLSIRSGVASSPSHSFRVPDPLWDQASEVAKRSGETVSDVVLRALHQYVGDTAIKDAERRGAVSALRAAARVPHNGADDFKGPRGWVHPQSLYNEGASPWLDGMADDIEQGGEW